VPEPVQPHRPHRSLADPFLPADDGAPAAVRRAVAVGLDPRDLGLQRLDVLAAPSADDDQLGVRAVGTAE